MAKGWQEGRRRREQKLAKRRASLAEKHRIRRELKEKGIRVSAREAREIQLLGRRAKAKETHES